MITASAVAGASLLGAAAAGNARGAESIMGDTSPHLNFSLAGKSAIVTGPARGIGRAIAIALAAAGADVMGIDIAGPASPGVIYQAATPEELADTGKAVEALKRRWVGVQADVRDYPALQAAAARAQKDFGKIDIVVANAAIQIYGPLAEMTDKDWSDVIDGDSARYT